MAAFENKIILYCVSKYPEEKPEPYRNQPVNLSFDSSDWFLHNTSPYQVVFASSL